MSNRIDALFENGTLVPAVQVCEGAVLQGHDVLLGEIEDNPHDVFSAVVDYQNQIAELKRELAVLRTEIFLLRCETGPFDWDDSNLGSISKN